MYSNRNETNQVSLKPSIIIIILLVDLGLLVIKKAGAVLGDKHNPLE